ncbi:MAG TPA: hypothetical protein VMU69_25940 [Bradyrhizobium sp.]|nr:hypothetical protein [Bradyrhizobium sp.]
MVGRAAVVRAVVSRPLDNEYSKKIAFSKKWLRQHDGAAVCRKGREGKKPEGKGRN